MLALKLLLREAFASEINVQNENDKTNLTALGRSPCSHLHRDSAAKLMANLGMLDQIHWELKPEGKSRIVNHLQAQGNTVAFVDDGVNDVPALVSSEVGVCMCGGSDLARESAKVVLLNDELNCLLAARVITQTSPKILQNSFNATIGLNSTVLSMASLGMTSALTSAIPHNSNTIGILGMPPAPAWQPPSHQRPTLIKLIRPWPHPSPLWA